MRAVASQWKSSKKNTLFYGGDSQTVWSVSNKKFTAPFKFYESKSKIRKLEISSDGSSVLVFTQDNKLNWVLINNQAVRTIDDTHEGAVLSGDVSRTAAASVGCDGVLYIYSINKTHVNELEAKHKIYERINNLEAHQQLECKFSPSGSSLALSGYDRIRLVRSSNWLDLNGVPNFTAKAEINTLEWIDDEILAVGTLDNTVTVLSSITGNVIMTKSLSSNIKSMKYFAGTLAIFLYSGDVMTLQ